ncbi:hypothetical protein [Providencia alcalifaciens]|uniref:hypothetical protein n=1 Tax=Providencia alcalifaciens TaxID=126385 RepID=UPI002AA0C606|nr:hypothetical protein [Providencia alcalifaciens]
MSQKEFAVGDEVIWTSQAQSYEREKTGTVVAVLKPHARFTNKHQESFPDLFKSSGVGYPRDEVSYVVRVPQGKTGKAKPKHYWPRTSALKAAK